MKVNVIEDKCIGCGQCEAVCDKVFQIGDEGVATVITDKIDENLTDDVKMAASGCPTDAIEVNECNCEECNCDNDEKCNCEHCDCSNENK